MYAPAETPPDYTSRLQYLDLSMANVSQSGLVELLTRCRQLKKLSLEHATLDDRICAQIAANRDIEVLNVTMAEGLNVHSVRLLLGNLSG